MRVSEDGIGTDLTFTAYAVSILSVKTKASTANDLLP
jgi:hypothetical protein